MSTVSFSSTSGYSAGSSLTNISSGTSPLIGTTYVDTPSFNLSSVTGTGTISISNNQSKIMQNKVAVFKVTRNDENEIISTEFLKEMWVQTKGNQKVDFEVARDKDLAKYKAEELDIRVLFFVNY
jgi:hypothetical protein